METCRVEGCDREARARELCYKHYTRWRKYGSTELPEGKESRPRRVRTCSVEDCDREHYGRGYCIKHYTRWRTHGDPHISHRAPKGAGTITPDGYKLLTVDGERILEQRHVMQEFLGRELESWEIVERLDGDRLNNDISNLRLVEQGHPNDDMPGAFWAWLAGFFDGDGSVTLCESHGAYYAYVSFCNTRINVLEEAQQIMGIGHVQVRKKIPGHLGKKPMGYLNLSNEAARYVLRKMLPFLRVKKHRAEVALEAYEVSPDKRPELDELIKHLNAKGKDYLPEGGIRPEDVESNP